MFNDVFCCFRVFIEMFVEGVKVKDFVFKF